MTARRDKAATLVTLATGRVLEVKGAYEDVTTTLAPRRLTEDTGMRQLTTTEGKPIQVATGAVLTVEPAGEARAAVGFR